MSKSKPLLSIGIIFRNDIRSIERCLEALTPLRKALSCELVMADTGSDDGSRAVAEKYADILFDFPWIDDFSAARNAVIDRCTGEWHLLVDTDEYLDPDISQLLAFFSSKDGRKADCCLVVQRNYSSFEMGRDFFDALAIRLVRPASGLRFIHPIHERLDFDSKPSKGFRLLKTILHHDGYVGLGDERGKAKRRRNLTLLEKERQERPEDLLVRLQLIESSWGEPEQINYLLEAASLVEEKKPTWDYVGPAIFCHAVRIASVCGLPETEAWIKRAEEWFPDSPYTRIDVESYAIAYYQSQGNEEECVSRGGRYLRACGEYRSGKILTPDFGPLTQATVSKEQEMRISLSELCAVNLDRPERAAQLLEELDFSGLKPGQIERTVAVLCNLQARSEQDLGPLLLRFYEAVCHESNEKQMQACRKAFIKAAFAAFTRAESRCGDFRRHSCTLFLPLAGRCEIGTAAAILEATDPETAERWLRMVEIWDELPIAALEHALLIGVSFPFADRLLRAEELNTLAYRMSEDNGVLAELTRRAAKGDPAGDMWQLAWTGIVALAAVQSCSWKDEEESLTLCRDFLLIQRTFLTRYYGPEMLREENIQLLPQMHRFIWHYERAFAALDTGDKAGYVHRLKEALVSCESMKPMVEFLLEHTPELQAPPPNPELLALAEQVRTMLSMYPPDDPAVIALKQSAAYQKVARLIEENIETPTKESLSIELFQKYLGSYSGMSSMLKTYGYRDILEQAAGLAGMDPAALEAHPMGGYSRGMTSGAYRFVLQDLLTNIAQYDWFYSRLEDEVSRMVYTNLIRYRLFPSISFIKAAYDSEHPHYFDKTIVACDDNEVFVDCGAYTGDSTESFIRHYRAYKHIYAYEPSYDNFSQCKKNLRKYPNITLKQCGVGDKSMALTMDSSGPSSTFMRKRRADGAQGIPIVSLDEDIQEKVTYCKMDIEGFEIPALQGAKKHIQNDFPKLAISAYHIVTDIWEIPVLIDKLHPGYHFFIRHYDPDHNWETVIYAIPGEAV